MWRHAVAGHSLLVNHHELEDVGKNQRSEKRADHPEQPNARERADEREHWMNSGDAPIHEQSNNVVDVRRESTAEDAKHDRGAEAVLKQQNDLSQSAIDKLAEVPN